MSILLIINFSNITKLLNFLVAGNYFSVFSLFSSAPKVNIYLKINVCEIRHTAFFITQLKFIILLIDISDLTNPNINYYSKKLINM